MFEEECDKRKELKGVSKETRQLYDLIMGSHGGILLIGSVAVSQQP